MLIRLNDADDGMAMVADALLLSCHSATMPDSSREHLQRPSSASKRPAGRARPSSSTYSGKNR